jgi:hypothetical protein
MIHRVGYLFLLSVISLFTGCGYGFQNSRNNALFIKEGVQKIYVAQPTNSTFTPGIEAVVYNSLVRTIVAHRRIIVVQNIEEADAVLTGAVTGATYGQSAATAVSGLNPAGLAGALPTAGFGVSSEYLATLSCTFALNRVPPKTQFKIVPKKEIAVGEAAEFPVSQMYQSPTRASIQNGFRGQDSIVPEMNAKISGAAGKDISKANSTLENFDRNSLQDNASPSSSNNLTDSSKDVPDLNGEPGTRPHPDLVKPKPSGRVALWSMGFSKQKTFPGANQVDVPGTTSVLINDSEFNRALSDLARNMMEDVHESMLAMF